VLEKRREEKRPGGGGVGNAEQTALSRACGVASASFALQGQVGQSEKWLERARRFLVEEHEEGKGGFESKGGEVMGNAGKEEKRNGSGMPCSRGDSTSGMVNRLKREHVVSLIDALRGFLDSGKQVVGGSDAASAAGGVLDLRALPYMVEGNARLQNDGRLAVPKGGMRIEVGSGSGEWARHQAQKSGGSWVCVERRFDRAWDGFAGAALRHVDGLVFVCGDSEEFLRDRVVAGTVANIVCRFPEPPVSSAHGEAWGEEAKGRGHMLAKGFWDAAAAALSTNGNATVITDNLEYARLVARCCSAVVGLESVPLTKFMAGDPTPPGGAPRDFAVREVVEGVYVHRSNGRRGGVDGAGMSYFDDLWQAGGHTTRYTIVLRKKAGGRSIAGHDAGAKAAQARSFYL
jgi:tRNA G46 methylase TrmB